MGLFDRFKKQAPARPAAVEVTGGEGAVHAPATGKAVAMASLPDPVFAGGAMGLAVGVWPDEGVVYAPVSGQVTAAMPHAIGIVGDAAEVLVHVGVDTVAMNGDGFSLQVQKGAQVKAGEPIVTFDKKKVAAAGHPDVVITVVTNTEDVRDAGGSVEPAVADGQAVSAGAPLITVG